MRSKTLWIIFVFMTLLMGFPFLFFYAGSTINVDILQNRRESVGEFGQSLSHYLESVPFEELSARASITPLPGNVKIDIYGADHTPLYLSSSLPVGAGAVNDSLRALALKGRRGSRIYYLSGRSGDRILLLSYPLREYDGRANPVVGALILACDDSSIADLLRRQWNHFALVCLVFVILLGLYLSYILLAIVFPMKRLLKKSHAIISNREYLLGRKDHISSGGEAGNLSRVLDDLKESRARQNRIFEEQITELKHTVRNPLSIIQVSLEALVTGDSGDHREQLYEIIQNNLSKIDGYISTSAPVKGVLDSENPALTFDLNAFLTAQIEEFSLWAGKKGIKLIFNPGSESFVWTGFPLRVNFILEQLLSNALDFSDRDSTVHIELKKRVGAIQIILSDEGCGIPSGREKDIFLEYRSYRGDDTGIHTGTGLYLARQISESFGGSLEGRNNNSRGARFTLTLPVSC
ncbi:MAG: HAMP domain-containing sensor histidine kinase [Spirochaetales bacterium]|nr:HAMP domain-containing sensor histidine kinase [Spirochaetales bacterium]